MNSTVPKLDSTLEGLSIRNLSGFRGQEDWGRWTLGKTASFELWAPADGWVEGRLDLLFPYNGQSLKLLLNGQPISTLISRHKNAEINYPLALNLNAGRNELQFITDKSNLDPSLTPFAPQDFTDMALGVKRLEFAPLQIFSEAQKGQLYGALKVPFPAAYQNVMGQRVDFFSILRGSQQLHYRLLSSSDDQTFEVILDGRVIHKVAAKQRGTLIREQLPLNLDGKLHQLSIRSSVPVGSARDDSLATIEKINGPYSFYIQQISLVPEVRRHVWEKPLATLGVLLGLVLLLLLLKGKGVRFSSSQSTAP